MSTEETAIDIPAEEEVNVEEQEQEQEEEQEEEEEEIVETISTDDTKTQENDALLTQNPMFLSPSTTTLQYHCRKINRFKFPFKRKVEVDFDQCYIRMYSMRTGGIRNEFPVKAISQLQDPKKDPELGCELSFSNGDPTFDLYFESHEVKENFAKNLLALRHSKKIEQQPDVMVPFNAASSYAKKTLRRLRTLSILLRILGWMFMFLSSLGNPGSAMFWGMILASIPFQVVGDYVARYRIGGKYMWWDDSLNMLGLVMAVLGITARTIAWWWVKDDIGVFLGILVPAWVIKEVGDKISFTQLKKHPDYLISLETTLHVKVTETKSDAAITWY